MPRRFFLIVLKCQIQYWQVQEVLEKMDMDTWNFWTQLVCNNTLDAAMLPEVYLSPHCLEMQEQVVPCTIFPWQHCCVSSKWHSAIGVLQHSPSPLASLWGEEDAASAVQMILGLLGEMTQERDNKGKQWDSALLSPRSRNGVVLKNMLILKNKLPCSPVFLIGLKSSVSQHRSLFVSFMGVRAAAFAVAVEMQKCSLRQSLCSKNPVGSNLLHPTWPEHALLQYVLRGKINAKKKFFILSFSLAQWFSSSLAIKTRRFSVYWWLLVGAGLNANLFRI